MNPKAGRRPDPIILLSQSASSLLRMSNIRSFLETGEFTLADGGSAPRIHISRSVPSIDHTRPIRFVVTDTIEHFKPEYWSRVVAVFTTGQAWQFKNYKWSNPTELFRHVLGVYVGWRGDPVPYMIKGWGRGVLATAVDKWSPAAGAPARFRDREVVETIWKTIEENMRNKGWRKDAGPPGA